MPEIFRTILICGGTGSLGHALTSFLLATTDATIRILSRGELLQAEMASIFAHHPRLRFFLGDVRDLERLKLACHGVDLVVHAAALKRIEKGEVDSSEFTKTNVFGTSNVITACQEAGVKRAIFISTDKMVHPVNTYGATKMLAERLWIQANGYAPDGTHFLAVRYANVAGSRGSVLPLWRAQRDAGQQLTVTDTRMTRFWLSLDEAVALVWFAAQYGPRGHVLVPHLPAFQIIDLLDAVCAPDAYRSIRHVGMRPGEKLHEALMTDDEMMRVITYSNRQTADTRLYAIPPQTHSWPMNGWETWPTDEHGMWYGSGCEGPYTSDVWKWRFGVEELRELVGTI